jgi:hypothetical protein
LERLIYIVGSARGGSSITQAIIGLHENVIAMSGPSSFLNHVWRYRNVLHDRLWRQLLWTPGYLRRAQVRDSLPEERKQAFIKLINRAAAEKDLHDLYQLYPLVKALDPDEKRDPRTFLAWLDKGNDFWGVDQLCRAFPEGRFVFVVRDPRGAVASLAKRTADLRPDTELKVEPVDVIVSAVYWSNLVRQQLRFARRHRGQAILFRFEDLTARPVEITQMLFEALDLPAVPKAELTRRLDSLAYTSSLDNEENGSGISKAPNERWKDRLSQESLDLIAGICGPNAQALGYNVQSSGKRLGWFSIVGRVPGLKHKLLLLAKLAFLSVVDRASPNSGGSLPVRLLLAE